MRFLRVSVVQYQYLPVMIAYVIISCVLPYISSTAIEAKDINKLEQEHKDGSVIYQSEYDNFSPAVPAVINQRKKGIHKNKYKRGHKKLHLIDEEIIRSGKVIELQYVKGALTIKAKGVLITQGKVGETVTVRNIDSKKILQGVIIDSNTVKVSND